MGDNSSKEDLQEAVDRSYRAQWGGRRFYLVTSIVFFVLAVLASLAGVLAKTSFGLVGTTLTVVEVSALTTGFVCLIAGVMFGMQALLRAQRERGQLPDRLIHHALSLSLVTLAGLLFLFYLFAVDWSDSAMGLKMVGVIKFIIFLFSGLAWLGSVAICSAAIAMLVTQRSDMLEVNNTNEGTALLLRRGHSGEITKLSIASIIPLILFVVAILMVGFSISSGDGRPSDAEKPPVLEAPAVTPPAPEAPKQASPLEKPDQTEPPTENPEP